MNGKRFALPLALLLCLTALTAGASAQAADGTWQRLDKAEISLNEAIGINARAVPYDEAAFEQAPDRHVLTDAETLAMKEATTWTTDMGVDEEIPGLTVEAATVNGKIVVRPIGGSSDIYTEMTPDGTTLITRAYHLESMWITTAEGSIRLPDEGMGGYVLVRPDGQGFAYSVSGTGEEFGLRSQIHWYDLTTHEDRVISADETMRYGAISWLDNNVLLCSRSRDSEDHQLVTIDRTGKETVLDINMDYQMVTKANGNFILTGHSYETVLDQGIQVVRYDGTSQVSPVYQFNEGSIAAWQQFFSPDGTKLLMAWAPETPSNDWHIRVADLNTGAEKDVTPPGWEQETGILFACWQDDNTLWVTACHDMPVDYAAVWEYTLPELIALPFEDVPVTQWYRPWVEEAYDMGLLTGTDETAFAPDKKMTYGEAVALAARMHQQYETGSVTLTNGDPWYQPYMDYCREHGILTEDISGVVNDPIDRQTYVGLFAKALPAKELAEKNDIPDGAIPDVTKDDPYREAIYTFYRAGILNGSSSRGAFHPNEAIKRSEVSAVLVRMLDHSLRVDAPVNLGK